MRCTVTACRSWPRSITTAGRHRRCTPGCRSGRRRRCRTRCFVRCRRRSNSTRSTKSSSPMRSWRPAASTAASTVWSCPVLPLLHRPGLPLARHQQANRPLRRLAGEPGPDSPRDVAAVRHRMGPGPVLGVRLCGDELIDGGTTIDDAVEWHARSSATAGSTTTQHLDRCRHRLAFHDRGVDAHPTGVRHVHPVGHPQGGGPAGDRRRPVQGSHSGRTGTGRRPCRHDRGGSGPDSADPDFVNKARAGRSQDTRLCLSCNQECVGRMGLQPVAGLYRESLHRT